MWRSGKYLQLTSKIDYDVKNIEIFTDSSFWLFRDEKCFLICNKTIATFIYTSQDVVRNGWTLNLWMWEM